MYNAEHLNADALCARGFEMEYKNKWNVTELFVT